MHVYKLFRHNFSVVLLALLIVLVFSISGSTATLQRGDIGPRVEQLQNTLNLLGQEVEADGVFGADTETAIETLQKNNDLRVDGIYGSETREAISAKLVGELETTDYEVEQGDTLSQIAEKQETSLEKIMILNELNSVSIKPGDHLEVPEPGQLDEISLGRGGESRIEENDSAEQQLNRDQSERTETQKTFTYTVRQGDTLAGIASNFDVDISTIRHLNNFSGDRIYAGQEIKLPGSDRSYENEKIDQISFMWPTTGRITSGFGHRQHPVSGESDFHTGIDIAVSHGTPIKAAASGRIVYAGWKSGYGYTVKINHGGDIKTLYAHNSSLQVNQGDEINKGEIIAYSGSSGTSTGPHLHFEIIEENNHVNPLQYLP